MQTRRNSSSHGRYSGASDQASEFDSGGDTWAATTRVCANLLGGNLKRNAEWRMELLDDARSRCFGFRLVAETVG